MDMEKIEKWLSTIPSKATRKSYLAGIRKFEIFYQKPIETLIGSENSGEVMFLSFYEKCRQKKTLEASEIDKLANLSTRIRHEQQTLGQFTKE